MAGTDVSSNMNLRITGDARELEAEFQKIVSEFRVIKTQLEDALNNPLSTSIEKISEIRDGFFNAAEGLKNLGGDYLKNSATSLADIATKLDTINSTDINSINRQFIELQAILEADNTKLANTSSVADDIIERFNKLNSAVQEAFSGQTLNNANAQMIQLSETVDKITDRIQQNIFEKQAEDALKAAQAMEKYNQAVEANAEAVNKMKIAQQELTEQRLEQELDKMTEAHERHLRAVEANTEAVRRMKAAQQELIDQRLIRDLDKMTEEQLKQVQAEKEAAEAQKKKEERIKANQQAVSRMTEAQQEKTYQILTRELDKMTDSQERYKESVKSSQEAFRRIDTAIEELISKNPAKDIEKTTESQEKQNVVLGSASEIWKNLRENNEFYSKEAAAAIERDNAQRRENLRILAEQGAELLRFNGDIAEAVQKYQDLADRERELNEVSKSTDKDIEVLKEAFGSGKDIIDQFASHLGVNTGKVQEFTTILGKLSPEGKAASVSVLVIVEALKILSKEADEALDNFKNLAVGTLKEIPDLFANIASGGIDLFVDSLSNMKDMIDTAIESLKELSEYGIATNDALFIMNNYLGNEGASQLHEYISALGELKGINVTKTEAALKGLYGSLSNMDLDAEELDRYAKTFVNFMNDLSVYQGTTVESIAGQLEAALSFGVLNSRSALAKALDINDVMIEQYKELATVEERAQWIIGRWPIFIDKYNQWMETDQGKVTMLKNTWENLMNTIGQLALKVYAMVAPLLTQILNLANSVLSGIYNLFNIDANSGVSSAVTRYSGLADSIEGVGKAAEKAQRKTASFDDVIQISDSKSGSDMSSAIGQAVDMAEILDEINKLSEDGESLWKKYSDAINKAISAGNWKEAGKLLGQFMYEWLDTINWGNIYENIYDFGRNLGDFFNGIVSNKETWSKAGETIGKSFNAIALGIKSFFSTFDGYDFGDSLGNMWKNMWDTFDEQQAADALYEVFNDVFETVAGFLGQGGFMSTAESVSKTITGFFGDIAEGGNTGYYANTMYDLAKNIFLSFANAIYEVVTDDNTKSTVRDAIGVLFMDLADDADNLANDLVTLVTGILEFVGDTLINPVNINFILNAIGNFIDTVADNKDKIIESLSPIINTLTDGLEKLVKSGKIAEVFNLIFDILAESGVFDLIAEWMNVQMQIKFDMFMLELKSKIMVLTSYLVDGALDVLEAVATGLKAGAGLIVAALYTTIVKPFVDLWGLISPALNELWTNFKTWWNNHFGGKSLIDVAIPDWIPVVGGKAWDFKIPALATGGIVTHSTIANIGEAGAEAVLPLERNTQWMDNLANKIASRMGNSNNAVTIDLSKCQKPFYTRSEMLETGEYIGQCLKLAGMNVSVVM